MDDRQRLAAGLTRLGAGSDAGMIESLLSYRDELARWNRRVNLTAVRDPADMVSWHLLDSLSLLPHLAAAPSRLIDIGTGAGLPGIPLAIAAPALAVTLLDAHAKKVRFLIHIKGLLSLDNVEVVRSRAEDYRPPEPFDTVVCRAFAALPEIVSSAGHLLAPGGRLLAMKGREPGEEIGALPAGWSAELHELAVPEVQGERHLVVLSREDPA